MQRGLETCAKELRKVEEKLIALRESVNNDSDHFTITEALSFIYEAQRAISKTQSQLTRLKADTVSS